jgi:hypothetical protein
VLAAPPDGRRTCGRALDGAHATGQKWQDGGLDLRRTFHHRQSSQAIQSQEPCLACLLAQPATHVDETSCAPYWSFGRLPSEPPSSNVPVVDEDRFPVEAMLSRLAAATGTRTRGARTALRESPFLTWTTKPCECERLAESIWRRLGAKVKVRN